LTSALHGGEWSASRPNLETYDYPIFINIKQFVEKLVDGRSYKRYVSWKSRWKKPL